MIGYLVLSVRLTCGGGKWAGLLLMVCVFLAHARE